MNHKDTQTQRKITETIPFRALWPFFSVSLCLCGLSCSPQSSVQSPISASTNEDSPDQKPTIRLNQQTGHSKATFEVIGLTPAALTKLAKLAESPSNQWSAVFAVYVDREIPGAHRRPAVLGSYVVQADRLRFEPRFPLQPGLRYQAVFYPWLVGYPATEKNIVAEFTLPRPPAAATTVVGHVYPSASLLPENQLKFYLHFSAPMSRGEAYRHIHLLEASGKEVDLPFLELDEELWDRQGKRFTLFFDPGRIKRGLKPREEVGPALKEGKSYTLVIDRDWPDANGVPLKEPYRKMFRVQAPDDQPVDPRKWKIVSPPAGTAQALTVSFPKPLDHALLERVLWVTDAEGRKIAGNVTVTAEETRWLFTPLALWSAGNYDFVAETTLEDLAGNSIGRPFEVDVLHPVQGQVKAEIIKLPFQVRPN